MTDLSRLGKEVRSELGTPPTGWAEQQSLRLRGLGVAPKKSERRPTYLFAAAALAVCAGLGLHYSGAFQLSDGGASARHAGHSASQPGRTDSSVDDSKSEDSATWLGADAEPTNHRLADHSVIELTPGTRGRLDEGLSSGTRFDLHEGTASFRISKREGDPFSVVAGDYLVVVVGTLFTVSYEPPRELSVTVDEGAVDVRVPMRRDPVRVEAGERLDVAGDDFSLDRTAFERENVEHQAEGDEPRQADGGAGSTVPAWQALHRKGQFREACQAARRRPLSHWHGALGASELMDLSTSLRLCGDAVGAVETLQALRKRFSGSSAATDALFLVGRIHATQGKTSPAISHFEAYVDAGGARFAPEALGRLIELHVAQGQPAKAKEFAARYLRAAPEGAYRRLAESILEKP